MIHDREQKSVLGCLVWSGVGVIIYTIVAVTLVLLLLGIPVLPDIPAKLGVVRVIKLSEIIEVKVPGETPLKLEMGTYQIYSNRSVPLDYNIKIKSENTGDFVELKKSGPRMVEIAAGINGLKLFTFEVDQSGVYTISEDNVASDTILIAPNFDSRNRTATRFFYKVVYAWLFIVVIVALVIWHWRTKAQRIQAKMLKKAEKGKAAQKKQKWDERMRE